MDLTTVTRRIARLEYTVVRLPFGLLEDRVITRCWDEDAPIRVGFEHLLGSLDEFAGRLLDDDEIRRRGQALRRKTGFPGPERGAGPEAPSPWAQAAAAEPEAPSPWAEAADGAEAPPPPPPAPAVPPAAREPAPGPPDVALTSAAPPGAVPTSAGPPGAVPTSAGPPGTVPTSAGPPGTVDVTFILPADVEAGRVALCGDFNDWSTDTIGCLRAEDGTWQATVPLEPGRSYRYRYLLDGERWENGGQADRYEPNPYGGVDSVVVVE